MKKLKIGIIGVGKIAETAHIPALLECKNAELSVLIESNLERVSQVKKNLKIDIPHIETLNNLNNNLDGIIICTPNDTHKALTLECLDRGIHVLVEKPLANSLKDAIEIQQKSIETDILVMAGYCTRFWSSIQYVKNIIDTKLLGEVKKFVFQYGAAGGWAPVSNYIISKKQAGGGAFVINGSHYLDRMIWYFGKPNSYEYYDDAIDGLEANALAKFNYFNKSSQYSGIIRISKTVNLTAGCYIEFEYGDLILQDWKNPTIMLKFPKIEKKNKFVTDNNEFKVENQANMYLKQLNEFIDKIQNKGYIGISNLEQAVLNTQITDELYKIKKPLMCNWYNK